MEKRAKHKIPIIIIVVLLVVAAIIGTKQLYIKNRTLKVTSDSVQATEREKKEKIERVKNTTYITDVDYTGETYLESDLFEIPFRKTDSGYISNKEFVKTVSENTLQKIQDTSKKYVHTLLGNGYQRVKNDQEGYMNEIVNLSSSQFCMIENGRNVLPEELAEKSRDWYIDNKIQMESEFVTDKCLIYCDGEVINRGEWHFVVYKGKDLTELEKNTGIENIEIGKEYVVYIEIRYIPNEYDRILMIQKVGVKNETTENEGK